MALTTKTALLNYLEFLKSSGFLYAEGDPLTALATAVGTAPMPAAPSPAARTAARPPAANSAARPAEAPAKAAITAAPVPVMAPALARTPAPAAAATEFTPAPAAPPMPAEPLAREARIARMEQAVARAEACRGCALGARRNRLVYGDGDPEAPIVFVGEAPGAEEDARGVPFVGRAGQLLNKMIAAIGFKREEVYICNTLKCRPPENRDPLPSEKAACEPFLVEQLQILRPRIIVALGAHAANYLCHTEVTIGKLRGRWHDYHGILLRATYHPSFLLRSPSFKTSAWEDFQVIHAKYCELRPDDPREIWKKEG